MKDSIQKYIELIIKKGIAIQKGQILVIKAPVETYDFVRSLVAEGYKNGAKEVVVQWNEEVIEKYRYLYGAEEIFDEFPNWEKEFLEDYRKKGAAFLSVYVEDPELLKDVDKDRIGRYKKARGVALKEYYDNIMGNSNQWCVVSIPSVSWAKMIFPNISENKAMENMWKLLLNIMRADKEDPVLEWDNHLMNLKKNMDYLNNKKFKKLVYKNSLGTNLEIELPVGHKWLGGSEISKNNIEFIANMPTEEIFTLPYKYGVNGVVYNSKPLVFGGSIIDGFKLVFKDGKVVEYSAKKGQDILEKMLDIDENSKYLGEVALVPYNSPISLSGKIFYNTLYDENASCHLAIGSAYPVCIENGDSLSEIELEEKGVNISNNHVDFMIGTKDLIVIGIEENGKEVTIIKDGNFAFTEK